MGAYTSIMNINDFNKIYAYKQDYRCKYNVSYELANEKIIREDLPLSFYIESFMRWYAQQRIQSVYTVNPVYKECLSCVNYARAKIPLSKFNKAINHYNSDNNSVYLVDVRKYNNMQKLQLYIGFYSYVTTKLKSEDAIKRCIHTCTYISDEKTKLEFM
ncbi:hypothetical protein EPTV-WA-184 [Eptesipox virus]|uniref:Uncharacterized protein n=1 Tax=Eptesipox virus TaxID=1329402 RepID=A0A220T671_9POXV|nr:hypothetical protein CG743_gp008 [Eptesipox virus]YP_009408135.1 hypothetical protein CG743_gp184 [Eptesipox virus]ASK51209.1 hypothetical protein EPTV-WA-008 [Eptesipox virus]ASK51385.1 hypothetical protein EPTV-WA-184 [Eptesipox virus]WAH70967.1 hypothetical protein CG743_gp008 [Eptesipox virus]WAH71143.1 hypothetical protein CG743_gp184 [Eptesipox virus]